MNASVRTSQEDIERDGEGGRKKEMKEGKGSPPFSGKIRLDFNDRFDS